MSRYMTVGTAILILGATAPALARQTMVGAAAGQTIRLVVTAGEPQGIGAGCVAVAQILTRGQVPAAEARFDLRAGESRFVEVNVGRMAGESRRRVELLPAVKVLAGSCSAAVEVHENITGRTLAYLPGLLLPASGAPTAGMGVALSQILRFGVIRGFDPQPDPPGCRAVLAFADAHGNPVGPSRAVDLEPGGSAFLDLDPNLLLPASGDPMRVRRFVRPQLLLPASGDGETRGCRASVQLYDRLTGWTGVAVAVR